MTSILVSTGFAALAIWLVLVMLAIIADESRRAK